MKTIKAFNILNEFCSSISCEQIISKKPQVRINASEITIHGSLTGEQLKALNCWYKKCICAPADDEG